MSTAAANPQLTDEQRQQLNLVIQSYASSAYKGMIAQQARIELLKAVNQLVQQTGLMPVIKDLNQRCRDRGFNNFWPVLSAFIESPLVSILQTGVGWDGINPPHSEFSQGVIDMRIEECMTEFLTKQPPNEDGSVTLTLLNTHLSVPSWEMEPLRQKQAICPDC